VSVARSVLVELGEIRRLLDGLVDAFAERVAALDGAVARLEQAVAAGDMVEVDRQREAMMRALEALKGVVS